MSGLGTNVLFGFDWLFVRPEARDELRIAEGLNETLYHNASETSLDRIDSKAGSLLTHISMMIAVATFVVSAADTSLVEQFVIGAEIIFYLFLAMCCLRCLVFVDVPAGYHNLHGGTTETIKKYLREQALMRGVILNFALRWTFLVTFVFALSLVAHLVL